MRNVNATGGPKPIIGNPSNQAYYKGLINGLNKSREATNNN